MRFLLIALILFFAALALVRFSFSGSDHVKEFKIAKNIPSFNEAPFYREETIDREETYPMAHVASLCELTDKKLIATWYAGSGEVQPDVKIYLSTKAAHEETWSIPRVIMTREKASADLQRYIKGLGNALIFSDDQGVLHLLYVTISIGKWSGSMLNLTSSRDEGFTWSTSERLCLSPFFNLSELVKNAPIALVGGGWVIPIYQEFLGKFPELLWLLPENHQLQASKTRIAGGCSYFQPSLTAVDHKKAFVFLRDYLTSGKISMTSSTNAGVSWNHPVTLPFPNHDSGISSLRLSNGWLLVAFNDSAVARDNLRLALSKDDGCSWQRIATIIEEPKGDFSYPYFFQSHDGIVHLLYSWKRSHIHHVTFNEAWIAAQAAQKK